MLVKKILLPLSVIFFITVILVSCEKFIPSAPADDEILDGPVDNLTSAQKNQFISGDIAFNDDLFTSQTGLGPRFVATSCGSCHIGDGKGHPSTTLVRFGQKDSTGNQFLHLGGPQLQNRALLGFEPEMIPVGATHSRFTPPANTGLGFLELVSDEDILAMSDPNDADQDGISGVPNWNYLPDFVKPATNAISKNGKYICRFGKKASTYNLLQQTVTAYNQDMGIVSSFNPIDTYSGLAIEPEVSDKTIHDVVFYLQTLKAPLQRNQNDAQIMVGKSLFIEIGCEKCHKETLKTGISSIQALSNQVFHPYTDLLLHDMGGSLDDGYTEGTAITSEWRTPALWGLGLSKQSQGNGYFLMHDGRAKSIQDAILMHDGEGKSSKNRFMELSDLDKSRLIKFLESL
ncbi:MAG: thiol oxidoreductase [Raineya sp.]|jgi:CxxC motif-containing protein (DUF1111 family)|nr:thiol oxidoreductase [Raineya sp.]